MKEYGIYRINNGGRPFMLDIYSNIDSAKLRIMELVMDWEKGNRVYYIDNDYYKNKYSFFSYSNLFYCQIKVREVSEWSLYSKDKKSSIDDNIIFLRNYKKTLTK